MEHATRGSSIPANALAGRRALITVCDLEAEAAQSLADEIGGEVWVTDLSDTAEQQQLSLETDILVNNAGIQQVAPIHEFDPETWRFMHRLMVESPFLLIRAALPGRYQRGFGRILNISSAHGMRGSAYKSAYVSAKHAPEGLSKVTALEGGETPGRGRGGRQPGCLAGLRCLRYGDRHLIYHRWRLDRRMRAATICSPSRNEVTVRIPDEETFS